METAVSRTRYAALLSAVCLLTAAAVTAAACDVVSSKKGTKTDIPATYRTSDAHYTLLYSTLGYEAAATKRILIRQNDPEAQVSEALAFEWQLVDAKGKQVASSHASYAGNAWGIPIWAADFSSVSAPGQYRLMVEAPDVQLATESFPIERYLAFHTTWQPIAIDDADARAAPIELDNGFFDTNSTTGSALAAGDFLVGLVESFDRRRTALTEDQKTRVRASIDRAIDYLLLLSDPGSGRVAPASPLRPYPADPATATAAGLRAFAHYAAVFQQDDAQKAQRAYRRARLAESWLQDNAPDLYTPALRATVEYDFYRYTGDITTLDNAKEAVQEVVSSYDLRTMDRHSDATLPDFEAMYRMWRDLPVDADRDLWLQGARTVATQYKDMLARNPFHVIAPGVSGGPSGVSAADQWDQTASLPPPGDGPAAVIGNDWFLSRAIDATYLASMTGDRDLEQVATASLNWVTGLNPGIPVARLEYTGGGSSVEAASFLTGLPGRSARTWSAWSWTRPRPFATIVNGFGGGFTYDDTDVTGETSLRHDGVWLYATAIYEDYINAGTRAQSGSASDLPPRPGAHVAHAAATESGGVMEMRTQVAGPDGAPLSGAIVVVAWTGAPLPDTSPDAAFHTTTCTTDASGACVTVMQSSDLPVRRPVTVSVTNIEHPVFTYDIASDDPSRTATLP